MAFIKIIGTGDADGLLMKLYDAAVKRAGGVANIVSIQGQNPRVLESSMGLYMAGMFGDSPLSRAQREMLATVVSKTNNCYY